MFTDTSTEAQSSSTSLNKIVPVVEAYIHMRIEPGKVPEVVKKLKMLPEIKEVHPVTGPYDVIAKVEVTNTRALTDFLITQIHKIEGIRDTMTSIILD